MKYFFYLLALFIIIPVIELLIILRIASHIGIVESLALIILTGIIGAYLARQQGVRVIHEIRTELNHGRLPGTEVLEGVLILVAAAVLMTPGLVTDIVGFLILMPICRESLSLWLARRFKEKMKSRITTFHMERNNATSKDDLYQSHNSIDIEAESIDDNSSYY